MTTVWLAIRLANPALNTNKYFALKSLNNEGFGFDDEVRHLILKRSSTFNVHKLQFSGASCSSLWCSS
uniref:Uncharacterized protein n=1 Tax=Romanomermis culicivorax TaxID=13658 RepID=A0A915KIV7_ROMCU